MRLNYYSFDLLPSTLITTSQNSLTLVNLQLGLLYEQEFATYADEVYECSDVSSLEIAHKKLLFILFTIASGKEVESYSLLQKQLLTKLKI